LLGAVRARAAGGWLPATLSRSRCFGFTVRVAHQQSRFVAFARANLLIASDAARSALPRALSAFHQLH
jgi:hypothetical protein